jgi:hypothetical protein
MDAGQHACVQKPQSMEAAIDTLKWYQHSKKAVQANRNMETLQFLLDEASSRAIAGLSLSCSPIAFKLAIISFI